MIFLALFNLKKYDILMGYAFILNAYVKQEGVLLW